MIEYKKGNLLDVERGIILHGCNAQGVMGSGVALAVKNKYPQAYEDYVEDLEERRVYLGDTSVYWYNTNLAVYNAITQVHYGTSDRHVNYWAIAKVFKNAVENARSFNMTLNFPKIGAGLGGGDWYIIENIINDCDYRNHVTKICWEL